MRKAIVEALMDDAWRRTQRMIAANAVAAFARHFSGRPVEDDRCG